MVPRSLCSSFLLGGGVGRLSVAPSDSCTGTTFDKTVRSCVRQRIFRCGALSAGRVVRLFGFCYRMPFSVRCHDSRISPPLVPACPVGAVLETSLGGGSKLSAISVLSTLILLSSPKTFLTLV